MKSLFKTTFRNLKRNPVTNLINLLGLTISLTLVIFLSAYCYSELTTDNHHKNGDNVYLYLPSGDQIYTPGILKENIGTKIPGVESAIRISGTWEPPVFQTENREPLTSDLLYADEDFFKLFTYNFVEGDPLTALKEPMNVVITTTLAGKLFGHDKVLGEIIKLNNSKELRVSAVIEEPETNSCLSFSAVTSIATEKIIQGEGGEYTEWGWCDFQTLLLLNKGINPVETEKTILNIIPEDFRDGYLNARLVPFKKIYFSKFTLYGNNYLVSGDKRQVMLLALVALLVLIIALVNFINISSCQWLERIKQTGILKVTGARPSVIFLQIIIESFFFFLAALLIAIDLVTVINPFIRNYTGIDFNEKLTYSPAFLLISLAGILLLSTIFSFIPALKISSSKAIDNLKNAVTPVRTRYSFSGALVTMQFTIAIVLIAFTLLVQKQVRFGSSNLGFDQENVIGITLTPQLNQKKEVLKQLLTEQPAISDVTYTQFYPGRVISSWGAEMNLDGEKKKLNFDTFSADAGFFEIMGLQLVMGRFYSEDLLTDSLKVVVNESFVRENNLVDPLGNRFSPGKRSFEIIGVVKDFHFKPFNQPITPLAIRNEHFASYCIAYVKTANFKSLNDIIQNLKTSVSELSPSFPVEVSFFDDAVENMYLSALRFRRTFSLFAGCAIIICCLGILAMSLFTSQRRIKEIGIRKVNGARISEILAMLNSDFVKWVGIAFLIACPVAWFAMYKWLQSYAYKTEMSWWLFVLAGTIALGIALLTVSWQSWMAATRNPVEALRYE